MYNFTPTIQDIGVTSIYNDLTIRANRKDIDIGTPPVELTPAPAPETVKATEPSTVTETEKAKVTSEQPASSPSGVANPSPVVEPESGYQPLGYDPGMLSPGIVPIDDTLSLDSSDVYGVTKSNKEVVNDITKVGIGLVGLGAGALALAEPTPFGEVALGSLAGGFAW